MTTVDPQAQQLVRRALTEHRTGRILRSGRPPVPSWVRPVHLGRNEADRAIERYLGISVAPPGSPQLTR